MAASSVQIKQFDEGDIDAIVATFIPWHKFRPQYEGYLREQCEGKRTVLVAYEGETVVGYVTILWQSEYVYFREYGIPEIVDLNVYTPYQSRGIGRRLIRAAEKEAAQRGYTVMGISVEQTEEYAKPNRLYPALGYIPNGYGISAADNELHMTRNIRNETSCRL